MPDMDFSAFPNDAARFAAISTAGPSDVLYSGWLPQGNLPDSSKNEHTLTVGAMPAFTIMGAWAPAERRYALWQAGKKLLGRHIRLNWQQSGSCVGCGGDNARKTLMCVEIVLNNDPEEYRDVWWPFTYGMSRYRAGIGGRGEGSTGSGWAKAATVDGCFAVDEDGIASLPPFRVDRNWLVVDASTEIQWSDGARIGAQFKTLGTKHLFKTVSRLRSADDVVAALVNGYGVTQASMFGFNPMVPKARGTPPVRIASWSAQWAHQTWIDEWWDHPTEGELFRWGNNWGPDAHGTPTGDEPPGGVYITKATMNAICQDSDSEVYAFSALDGFPARTLPLDFSAFG